MISWLLGVISLVDSVIGAVVQGFRKEVDEVLRIQPLCHAIATSLPSVRDTRKFGRPAAMHKQYDYL